MITILLLTIIALIGAVYFINKRTNHRIDNLQSQLDQLFKIKFKK